MPIEMTPGPNQDSPHDEAATPQPPARAAQAFRSIARSVAWARARVPASMPPAGIHALGVTLAVIAGVAIGQSMDEHAAAGSVLADAEASALVEQAEADLEPVMEMARRESPGDWADSVFVPQWVREGAPMASASRSYVRFGSGEAPLVSAGTRPDLSYAPARAGAQPLNVAPLLVRRIGGSRVVFHDIGLGEPVVDPYAIAPDWSLAGSCSSLLGITGRIGRGGTARAEGRELGRIGDWIFGLAVPQSSCTSAASRSAERAHASANERRGLSFAVNSSEMLRGLGMPSFTSADLADFYRGRRTASGQFVWGVFRRSTQTTQVYPPPPNPQLAFVAHSHDGDQWEILWGKYTDLLSETVGMAGVFDIDQDSNPDAFFAIRSSDGNSRILHVAPDAQGVWRLARAIPFEATQAGP
jgi:hypothetical protein